MRARGGNYGTIPLRYAGRNDVPEVAAEKQGDGGGSGIDCALCESDSARRARIRLYLSP